MVVGTRSPEKGVRSAGVDDHLPEAEDVRVELGRPPGIPDVKNRVV
jgi:hypothetical protein